MSDFLGHGVVLVVLVSPPRSAHAASDTIQDNLKSAINLDVACLCKVINESVIQWNRNDQQE